MTLSLMNVDRALESSKSAFFLFFFFDVVVVSLL